MARYYNPQIGRFVSEDPLREHGESFEIAGFLDSIPFYVYVKNQPARYRDPFGFVQMPGPVIANDREYSCGFDIAVKARFSILPTFGPRFSHCWASCQITKSCGGGGMSGTNIAENLGEMKELSDVIMCSVLHDKGHCDSAWQPSDFHDNGKGRSCPLKQNCWEHCKDLIPTAEGPRDAPPGPMHDLGWW